MKYLFAKRESYGFLAPGSVLYAPPGVPNFPVRIGHEIYNWCLSYRSSKSNIRFYDPCCGGGYLLATICLLNADTINNVIGSDINPVSIEWANKNLSLLSKNGLDKRKSELQELFDEYAKDSHLQALQNHAIIEKIVNSSNSDIESTIFQRDITSNQRSPLSQKADIIITDVPYGQLVHWSDENGIDTMLEQLKSDIDGDSIISIIHNKYQKRSHSEYQRLKKFKVGKRIVEILRLK